MTLRLNLNCTMFTFTYLLQLIDFSFLTAWTCVYVFLSVYQTFWINFWIAHICVMQRPIATKLGSLMHQHGTIKCQNSCEVNVIQIYFRLQKCFRSRSLLSQTIQYWFCIVWLSYIGARSKTTKKFDFHWLC